jgi:hypothetical protein
MELILMVDCETTSKKYRELTSEDVVRVLDAGHTMKIEYIAERHGPLGYLCDSENQPIKEPFGIIEIKKENEEMRIKLTPNQMVNLINYMANQRRNVR